MYYDGFKIHNRYVVGTISDWKEVHDCFLVVEYIIPFMIDCLGR